MKKLTALLLTGFMALSLTACSESSNKTDNKTSAPENTVTGTKAEQETNGGADSQGTPTEKTEAENAGEGTTNEDTNSKKILVAYFSATHTTEGVAKAIAESLNADLYEIVPENPYTSADLDYNDKNSRSTAEMNDKNSRPAISGSVEDMGKYDIVFIGYPIWWGDAPRIISTFVESYDFEGKTVVPFCTSASSGVGSSASNIEKLAGSGTWLSGTRLNGNTSRSDAAEWVNGLDLGVAAE
ncbi:MAG: flavodoxin [Ruminiclostridium sp.]|nr:flavodoxin [Ruminiclostridium sp.]